MVNYNCIRCGYETNDRSKMKSHLSRKTVCKPLLNDVNLDDYKNDIFKTIGASRQVDKRSQLGSIIYNMKAN